MSTRYLAYVACFMLEAGSVIGTEPPAPKPALPEWSGSVSCFVAFPGDCNANPPMVFGGKLLAEMDRIAGITTRRFLYNSPTGVRDAVTVAINGVKCHRSAQVKDLIVVMGHVAAVGAKSVTIAVRVERETMEKSGVIRELLAEGEFVFVAYDREKGVAVPHGLSK